MAAHTGDILSGGSSLDLCRASEFEVDIEKSSGFIRRSNFIMGHHVCIRAT
jgi:hypothetical protein